MNAAGVVFSFGFLVGIVIMDLIFLIPLFLCKEKTPGRIDPEKAKNAFEASYIEGWNDCVARTSGTDNIKNINS